MNITMENIDERLKEVETDTKQILFILESNRKTNSKGLVETVQENKEAVELIKLQRKVEKATQKTTAGIFGGIGAAVATVIYMIASALINQKIK